MTGLLRMVDPCHSFDDREDSGGCAVIGDTVSEFPSRQIGSRLQQFERHDLLLQVLNVVGRKAIPPGIKDQTKAASRRPRSRQVLLVEIDGQIGAADRQFLVRLLGKENLSAITPVGEVQTVVKSETKAVRITVRDTKT